MAAGHRWWPWLLLLLLPACGYGLHYTYENLDHMALPNFTDFHLDLSEFSISLPNVSLPSMPRISLPELPAMKFPEINITLPDVDRLPTLPEVTKTYREYKAVVQNRMADASSYIQVVAESCWEEMRRGWQNYLG